MHFYHILAGSTVYWNDCFVLLVPNEFSSPCNSRFQNHFTFVFLSTCWKPPSPLVCVQPIKVTLSCAVILSKGAWSVCSLVLIKFRSCCQRRNKGNQRAVPSCLHLTFPCLCGMISQLSWQRSERHKETPTAKTMGTFLSLAGWRDAKKQN